MGGQGFGSVLLTDFLLKLWCIVKRRANPLGALGSSIGCLLTPRKKPCLQTCLIHFGTSDRAIAGLSKVPETQAWSPRTVVFEEAVGRLDVPSRNNAVLVSVTIE